LFCINPIGPVDVTLSETPGDGGPDGDGLDLEQRGLPTVLSQTFRTLIHSRLTVGMKAYENRYRDAHVVLFEPDRDDYRMFFTNIFSFSARRRVASHAYRAIRRDLLERADDLGPILARHGARLRLEVLRDEDRDLWEGVGLTRATGDSAAGQTLDRVDRAIDRIEKLLG
jgi:hypothetical protein